MACRVFGCNMDFENPENTAKAGIREFRRFLSRIGMPINFEELGAKPEDIPLMVEKLNPGEGHGFVPIRSEDATAIYQLAVGAKVE
jgi:alcohol dehydrogenase YqhD (iron-dependent ADH family)